MSAIPMLTLSSGEAVPRLGLGTWRMGESAASSATRHEEVAVVRHAIEQGITLIDTAEMYGEGGAEEVVGEAMRGQREPLFLVSKVYPWNASRRGTIAACERSLKRLGTDRIDLYLLHWRGEHPLADTVAAFEALKRDGKIRQWGVSNFDVEDLRELAAVPHGGACVANQVYYNLAKRWPETSLMALQREYGIATMAYSPLDQGRLIRHPALLAVAKRLGATPTQVALAWLLCRDGTIAIPKSGRRTGVDEIVGAAALILDDAAYTALARAFPLPERRMRMETT